MPKKPLSNAPSDDVAFRENLAERNRDLHAKLSKSLADFRKQPAKISAETIMVKVGDVVGGFLTLKDEIEQRRVAEKEPYLRGGVAVDDWFKTFRKPLLDAISELTTRIDAFQDELEAERRKLAEKEAEARRLEAEKLEKAAKRKKATEIDRQAAEHANLVASQAEAAAEAPAADLVRARSETRTLITRKTEWAATKFDIEKLDLDALRPYLAPAHIEAALGRAVRAGLRSIRGATIEEIKSAAIRRQM